MPKYPDPFESKLGNEALANFPPKPCYASGAYNNRMFYFIDGRWWAADKDNVLRNVVDKELFNLLTNHILQPQG